MVTFLMMVHVTRPVILPMMKIIPMCLRSFDPDLALHYITLFFSFDAAKFMKSNDASNRLQSNVYYPKSHPVSVCVRHELMLSESVSTRTDNLHQPSG